MEGNIETQLKILLKIQDLDLKINSIKRKMEEIPKRIKEGEKLLNKEKEEIEKFKKEIEKAIVGRKNKEVELESNLNIVKKYQSQLYTVKTNKEYASLLHETEELKRKNALIEDEILDLMEKIESGEISLKKNKEELKEKEEKYKKKVEEDNKRFEKLNNEKKELEKKGKELSSSISQDLLAKYKKLLNLRGIAIVPIVNGTCGGCHLELPPQVINEAKSGKKIVTCERCSRILYWENS